jgi:hypothetical protein
MGGGPPSNGHGRTAGPADRRRALLQPSVSDGQASTRACATLPKSRPLTRQAAASSSRADRCVIGTGVYGPMLPGGTTGEARGEARVATSTTLAVYGSGGSSQRVRQRSWRPVAGCLVATLRTPSPGDRPKLQGAATRSPETGDPCPSGSWLRVVRELQLSTCASTCTVRRGKARRLGRASRASRASRAASCSSAARWWWSCNIVCVIGVSCRVKFVRQR